MRHIRKFGGLLLITLMLLCVRGLGQEYVGTSSNRPSLSTSPRLLVGNILYETDTAAWRVWTGTAWVQAASIAPVGPLRVATSATRPTITNTPRLLVGDKLFESDTGVFRIWDGTEWKVLTFPGGSGETENAITQEDEFTVAGQFVKAAAGSGRATEPSTCYEDANGLHCGDGETPGAIAFLYDDAAALDDPDEGYGRFGVSSTGKPLFKAHGVDTVELATLYTVGFVLFAPVATDDFVIFKAPFALTIVSVNGVLAGSTNVVGQVQECTSAGASCVDTDSDITFDGGNDADDGTFTNASIDAGDWVAWKTTSVSGTPTALSVTITYRKVPE